MMINATTDAVDWTRAPLVEELYDNADMDDLDFDSADAANLLAFPAANFDKVRAVADRHLDGLRAAAADRHFRTHGQYATRLHTEHPLVAGAAMEPHMDRSRAEAPPRGPRRFPDAQGGVPEGRGRPRAPRPEGPGRGRPRRREHPSGRGRWRSREGMPLR